MKHFSSALFIGIWVFLFRAYEPSDFTLALVDTFGGHRGHSDPTAWWMFIPLVMGLYSFVAVELERWRKRQ